MSSTDRAPALSHQRHEVAPRSPAIEMFFQRSSEPPACACAGCKSIQQLSRLSSFAHGFERGASRLIRPGIGISHPQFGHNDQAMRAPTTKPNRDRLRGRGLMLALVTVCFAIEAERVLLQSARMSATCSSCRLPRVPNDSLSASYSTWFSQCQSPSKPIARQDGELSCRWQQYRCR